MINYHSSFSTSILIQNKNVLLQSYEDTLLIITPDGVCCFYFFLIYYCSVDIALNLIGIILLYLILGVFFFCYFVNLS
jgi:hypothetical protein